MVKPIRRDIQHVPWHEVHHRGIEGPEIGVKSLFEIIIRLKIRINPRILQVQLRVCVSRVSPGEELDLGGLGRWDKGETLVSVDLDEEVVRCVVVEEGDQPGLPDPDLQV